VLGEELRRVRREAGLSQEQVAFRANLDRSYVSQLENSHKSPTVDVLFRLCDALNVKASDILARVERRRAGGQDN
jgi:transcriptional regulator with XRE-family HTH domain